jgi:hypothetical protein
MHRGGWALVAVFIVGIALSACSSPSTPGVLTQADIPTYLGVKFNPSESASQLRQIETPPCKTLRASVFTAPGQRVYEEALGPTKNPQVTSVTSDCTNASRESVAYRTLANATTGLYGAGSTVSGVGAEAKLFNIGKVATSSAHGAKLYLRGTGAQGRAYAVIWRASTQIDTLILVGAGADQRITPALAELLARRAAAGS